MPELADYYTNPDYGNEGRNSVIPDLPVTTFHPSDKYGDTDLSDPNYDHEGNTKSLMGITSDSIGKDIDPSLLDTIKGFLKDNKELTSMFLQGLGNAQKNEAILQLWNRNRDAQLADRKAWNDARTNMAPLGLIASQRGVAK